MSKARHIFYRGSLKFCNYSCSYCPFSKGKGSEGQFQQDRNELFRFVDRLEDGDFQGAVQIVPYGEALIHEYYWEALARLSACSGIEAVGAQTNLSFPVEKMLSVYKTAGGEMKKLHLWGTFHPEMVSMDRFLKSCDELLQGGVKFCVGSVGVPENILLLRELRDRLDPTIYLWVNKMDGLGRNYTPEEVEALCEIDEYFELELRHYTADVKRCQAAIFVDSKGDVHSCNRCKNSVGNIYETSLEKVFREGRKKSACHRKECDCYIAYSNRADIEELVFFHPYPAFRIPAHKKAVFFDIDGTLVPDGEREIGEGKAAWLRRLATHSDIFLATSLPYEDAMRKMHPVASVIRGGVFAGGGRLRIDGWDHVEAIDEEVLAFVERLQSQCSFRFRTYKRGKQIYKIVISFWTSQIPKPVLWEVTKLQKYCHVIMEGNKVELTTAGANKLSGVKRLCQKMGVALEEVAVFGNSETDLEMMNAVTFSVAAAGSCEAVKEVATVVLE